MRPTLVSRDVTRRLKEKEELKQIQKYEMGVNQVNQPNNLFGKSTSAINDKYIHEPMKKVNESNTTIDENLSRMHGTFFFNRNELKELMYEFDDNHVPLSQFLNWFIIVI